MPNVVFVVGLGPGDPRFLTAQAQSALTQAEVLCGYTVYLDLVRPYFPDKLYYSTGMTREIDRCRWALETARSGRAVALVCSGDAGVYGMASPLLELAEHFPDVTVEVVPGLTAALSGGAVLGAPLAHDFCVLSLSDRLTPRCTTPPPRGGRTIWRGRCASCWQTAKHPERSAVLCGTLAGRGRKAAF